MQKYCALTVFTSIISFAGLAHSEPVELSPREAAAVLWAHTGDCSSAVGEADTLLCEEVKAGVSKSSQGQRYFRRRRARVTAGVYGQRRSIPLSIESCIYCEGVQHKGQLYRVVGRIRRNQAMPAPLKETAKQFRTKEEADTWVKDVLPRLITELSFELPDTPPTFRDRSGAGLLVDIKAYRVYDPCTGEVVAAVPSAKKVKPDEALCVAAEAAAKTE